MKHFDPVIAAAGQSDFSVPGLTVPALITVNGIILQPADFAIDGETVQLVAGVADGDEVGAIVF